MIQFHRNFASVILPQLPSERKFGLVIGSALLIFSVVLLNYFLLTISASLILLAVIYPKSLKTLNRLWMGLGDLLHRVINPGLMFLLYFVCFVPLGLVMQYLFRYDPMQARFEKQQKTYWKNKPPIASSMEQQF